MPVRVIFIEEIDVVLTLYSGQVTIADIATSYESYSAPQYRSSMAEVTDLNEVTGVDLGFDEVMTYTAKIHKFLPAQTKPVPHIFVGNNAITKDTVEIYESLAQASDVRKEIFSVTGYPEVLAHLNLPERCIDLFPKKCQLEAHLLKT